MNNQGKVVRSEEVKGKKQIPYLKRDIKNNQDMIEIHKGQIEKLRNPEFLKCMLSDQQREEAIKKSEDAIAINEWLIEIMQCQLNDLLRKYPEKMD